MKLGLKLIARWTEPEAFRISEENYWNARTPPWQRPLYVLLLAAVLLLNWFIARFNPSKHPISLAAALALTISTSLLLLYGLPWLLRRLPSTVNLYERSIMRRGWHHARPLNSFVSYAWLAENSYHVLELTTPRGHTLRFGLPDASLREKIDPVLRENKLVEIEAKPRLPQIVSTRAW
jgi:hypothetical protein